MQLIMCYMIGREEIQKQINTPLPPGRLLLEKDTGGTLTISPALGILCIIAGDTTTLGYLTWVSTLPTGALLLSEEAASPKGLYPTLQVPGQKSFHINWSIPHVVGRTWACPFPYFFAHISLLSLPCLAIRHFQGLTPARKIPTVTQGETGFLY